MWPWSRGAPQYFGVPNNIPATAEASNFKIGMLLGFAKAHRKIPRRRKNGRGFGLELPKILGFPFNTSATAEASNIKLGMQLGFTKAHRKSTPRGKVVMVLA